jgi:hypothetical protein
MGAVPVAVVEDEELAAQAGDIGKSRSASRAAPPNYLRCST